MQVFKTDYLVIGSGLAGFNAAYWASRSGDVMIITKGRLEDCNSALAQGGIAAAVGSSDKPKWHAEDTLFAGAGICDTEAVTSLTEEAPSVINFLLDIGVQFDRDRLGQLALAREGAHRMARVLHHGDGTGAEIWRALYEHLKGRSNVKMMENTIAEQLYVTEEGCQGAFVRTGEGISLILASAVVLATGGVGQLFGRTTSSLVCTGDGLSLAWQAGAILRDLEFIQFHPTSLRGNSNPSFLISEAVRGEGAVLVNENGEPFMKNYHPMADLAPRDVVSRAILNQEKQGQKVLLDATRLGKHFAKRFPNINQIVAEMGLNPEQDSIPVTPAAHYTMGGVKTDSWGQTTVDGLFACGEVACTGVHGANRLASNSLLEALVFGQRVAQALMSKKYIRNKRTTIDIQLSSQSESCWYQQGMDFNKFNFSDPRVRSIQELMWTYVGILRSEQGLTQAYRSLKAIHASLKPGEVELRHFLNSARLVTQAALTRLESRGGHYRLDYPHLSPTWEGVHIEIGGNEHELIVRTNREKCLTRGRRVSGYNH